MKKSDATITKATSNAFRVVAGEPAPVWLGLVGSEATVGWLLFAVLMGVDFKGQSAAVNHSSAHVYAAASLNEIAKSPPNFGPQTQPNPGFSLVMSRNVLVARLPTPA